MMPAKRERLHRLSPDAVPLDSMPRCMDGGGDRRKKKQRGGQATDADARGRCRSGSPAALARRGIPAMRLLQV